MYQSKKSIICFFLAVLVFFYSWYYIAMEADSFQDIALSARVGNMPIAEGNAIVDEKISAGEILNTNSLSVGQSVIHQFRIARKVVRLSWSFLVIQIFNFFIAKFFVAICLMEIPKLHKNMAVLQYIHDIDGKK